MRRRAPPTRARQQKSRRSGSLRVIHASELLTLRGGSAPRTGSEAGRLGGIEDGAVFIEGDRIVDVGTTQAILRRHPRASRTIDASDCIVLPGFVDAHTHAAFAGSRAHEVEWKAQGLSYRDIAERGGGILQTVRATRDASESDLAASTAHRLGSMQGFGTTTVEIKSGYGLRTPDELKLLRSSRKAETLAGMDVVTTFLGAHAVPTEFSGRSEDYVRSVIKDTLPAVAEAGLATFCDVFVDEGYFSPEQGRRLLETGSALGLRPKVHADELSDAGGCSLAAETGAVSADHLNHASADGIAGLARAGVIGVLLPATSLTSRLPFADGRRLVTAGVPLALGTDFSPNTWCESMPLVIALACHHNGLTAAEAIVAATINAAHAVGRGDRVGSLEPGKAADLVVLEIPTYHDLGYRLGSNVVREVVSQGRVVPSGA